MNKASQFLELLATCKTKSTAIHQQLQQVLSSKVLADLIKKYRKNIVLENGDLNVQFQFRYLARHNREESYSSETTTEFNKVVSDLRDDIKNILGDKTDFSESVSSEYGTFTVNLTMPIDPTRELKQLLINSLNDPSLVQADGDAQPRIVNDSIFFSSIHEDLRQRIIEVVKACGFAVNDKSTMKHAVFFYEKTYI